MSRDLRIAILDHLRKCAEPTTVQDMVITLGERDGTRIRTELTNMVNCHEVQRHHSQTGILSYSAVAAKKTTSTKVETAPRIAVPSTPVIPSDELSLSDRVYAALVAASGPLTNATIRSATGGGMQPVSNALQKLLSKRLIVRCGEGANIAWMPRDRAPSNTAEATIDSRLDAAFGPAERERNTGAGITLQSIANGFAYRLSTHVDSAIKDLDDIMVDAIRKHTPAEILTRLVAARTQLELAVASALALEKAA